MLPCRSNEAWGFDPDGGLRLCVRSSYPEGVARKESIPAELRTVSSVKCVY
ncbi:hypothetical protein HMPREF1986_01099 [Oribacterium sp. oral taxon 078 str. F0263]|nr:hypothetical protein HMPREF1986_01099 [Oribacterium sp. oral taxon 078 str. F0263]